MRNKNANYEGNFIISQFHAFLIYFFFSVSCHSQFTRQSL